MPVWLIILGTALCMARLFAMAWRRDREAAGPGFTRSLLIYALALAVCCASWTSFGAVGTAASSGWGQVTRSDSIFCLGGRPTKTLPIRTILFMRACLLRVSPAENRLLVALI